MSSLTQFKSRGRAYQCKRCHKTDRKGRVVSHVLKHHVPFDQVPFSCSLCSFRCQDRQSLMDHIRKYSRHREEEAKLGAPDYTKILKMSANPYYIGDDDITQLSREDSLRWFSRNYQSENSLDEFDGMFEDEEDEVATSGGLSFPRWLLGVPLTSPANTQPLGAVTTTTSVVKAPLFIATTLQGYTSQTIPTIPSFASQPSSFNPMARTTQQIPYQPPSFSTIDQTDLHSIAGYQPLLPPVPPVATRSSLNTPDLNIQPHQYPPTPCLDENILPGLMNFDRSDPLFMETLQVHTGLASSHCGQTNEPMTKKARHEVKDAFPSTNVTVQSSPSKTSVSSSAQSVPSAPPTTTTTSSSTSTSSAETSSSSTSGDTNSLISVIVDAAKLIAGAIDGNTRAIRCQEKTLEKAVDELARIERKLNQLERTQAERYAQTPIPPAVLKENKPNNKSAKSRVSSVKPK